MQLSDHVKAVIHDCFTHTSTVQYGVEQTLLHSTEYILTLSDYQFVWLKNIYCEASF